MLYLVFGGYPLPTPFPTSWYTKRLALVRFAMTRILWTSSSLGCKYLSFKQDNDRSLGEKAAQILFRDKMLQ